MTHKEERLHRAAPALLTAAKAARSALDRLMGDTDLEGDDSPEFVAMQMLSAAIDAAEDWPLSQQYEGKGS